MANQVEYGLFQMIDQGLLNPNTLANVADSGLLVSGILYDVAQHNADVGAVLRLFAQDTTDYQTAVEQTGAARNQPLDENGRSIPIKPVAPYTVAFPIQGSGNAWGANFVARAQMTVRDMARTFSRMYRGDYEWVVDHVLGAIFANASYAVQDPTGKGSLTVRGLANGDTTNYYFTTTGQTGTDTHYLAQAGAISDAANPYPTIKSKLTEHPDNGGEVIAFVPTNAVSTTQGLAEFNSAMIDPDVQLGANTDRLTGNLNLTLPLGASVKGKTDSGVWVVEWPRLPSDYIVGVTTQGPRPLARRQFAQAELQGFRAAGTRDSWPYFEEQWHRWEGYGAFNRVGAVVYRVNSGTYTVPTGYTMPMA